MEARLIGGLLQFELRQGNLTFTSETVISGETITLGLKRLKALEIGVLRLLKGCFALETLLL
jgi:hypothetical protein